MMSFHGVSLSGTVGAPPSVLTQEAYGLCRACDAAAEQPPLGALPRSESAHGLRILRTLLPTLRVRPQRSREPAARAVAGAEESASLRSPPGTSGTRRCRRARTDPPAGSSNRRT